MCNIRCNRFFILQKTQYKSYNVLKIIHRYLKCAATGIILAHNHPSGNLQPSVADEEMTKKIKNACEYLDIKLLDHLIITLDVKYLSFTEEGLL